MSDVYSNCKTAFAHKFLGPRFGLSGSLQGYMNLIVVLHGVFMDILPSDPPRALSTDVDLKTRPLNNIELVPGFLAHPEKVIASIIKKRLGIFPD